MFLLRWIGFAVAGSVLGALLLVGLAVAGQAIGAAGNNDNYRCTVHWD